MQSSPLDRLKGPETVDDNRRYSGRLKQDTLKSSLGPVLDISAGGMRVRCRKVPVGEIVVVIGHGEDALTVRARVAWTKQIGFRKHEVGLQFLDMPEDMSNKICGLGLQGRVRRLI